MAGPGRSSSTRSWSGQWDCAGQKLYWCDAKMDRIEMSNMDGFSMLGEFIYWTDWQDRNIQRGEKEDGSHRVVLVSHLDDLVSVILGVFCVTFLLTFSVR